MPHLEHRRGRWHYHYVVVVDHYGQRVRREIRCLSEYPESEKKSQESVYLHRERTKAAIREEIEREIERESEELLGVKRPAFRRLTEEWLADAEARGLYLKSARYMIRILQDEMPEGPAADILPGQIRAVRDRIRSGRGLAPRTINHYMTLAHGVFQLAINEGRLKDSAGRRIGNPVAAARLANQIEERSALSDIAIPALPEDFPALLAKTTDDIAKDAESHLAEHLAAHGMEADGGNWIAKARVVDGPRYFTLRLELPDSFYRD